MATVKHIASKNSDYCDPLTYLTYQHNESSNKPILDDNGHMVPRPSYKLSSENCLSPYTFASECLKTNRLCKKNTNYRDIKTHHYIISFDPKDKEAGLTMEKAQGIGIELARKCFQGYQALICTHPDGNNHSGNIHVHIIINSIRKIDADRQDYMEKISENKAGFKHRSTKKFNTFLKLQTMKICEREKLNQVDLITPAAEHITDQEYRKQQKGQIRQDKLNAQILKDGLKPRNTRYETDKRMLRSSIRSAVKQSHTEDEFKKALLEKHKIEVTESRGKWGYKAEGKARPTRARMLGSRYEKEYIIAELTAVRQITNPDQLKSRKYKKAAELENNKNKAATINYLLKYGLADSTELDKKCTSTAHDLEIIQTTRKKSMAQLNDINSQLHYKGIYLANKKFYDAYLQLGKDQKVGFYNENRQQIDSYKAARTQLQSLAKSSGKRIPTLKELKEAKEQMDRHINEIVAKEAMISSSLNELNTIKANYHKMLTETQSEHTIMNEKKPKSR
jgi:hypothetical protein